MAIDPDEADVSGERVKAERSMAGLVSDLAAEAILLIRQEMTLLKTELSEKFSQAGQGIGLLVAGGVLAFSAWLVLLAAAVLGLALVLPPWLAALIVGLAVLAIGGVLLFIGKKRLEPGSLVPQRTLRSLREDQTWLTERLR